MDENIESALKIYGQFLDGESPRMDGPIIQAIKTLREYVFARDPADREIHNTLVTAKRKKLSGTEMRALVEAVGSDEPK